jgi:hypothetical protein
MWSLISWYHSTRGRSDIVGPYRAERHYHLQTLSVCPSYGYRDKSSIHQDTKPAHDKRTSGCPIQRRRYLLIPRENVCPPVRFRIFRRLRLRLLPRIHPQDVLLDRQISQTCGCVRPEHLSVQRNQRRRQIPLLRLYRTSSFPTLLRLGDNTNLRITIGIQF